MSIASANELNTTPIKSFTAKKKPTTQKTPQSFGETKAEHSLHSSLKLDIFMLKPENQVKYQTVY